MTLEDLPFFAEAMSSTIAIGQLHVRKLFQILSLQPFHEIYDLEHDCTLVRTEKKKVTLLQHLLN